MYTKRSILWFRQDLRLHDNEALTEALSHSDEVIPIYVFDERFFSGDTKEYGFPKIGKFRAQFIIESVADLRESLKSKGCNLIVRVGKPEEVILEIARKVKSSWVFCNRERTRDEVEVQDALERNLWSIGQEMRYSRGKLLYYTADLPFPITHTPDTFSQFRKEVERYVPVRDPLPAPGAMPYISVLMEEGEIPTLPSLGYHEFEEDSRAAISFEGGETAALERLQYYIWNSGHLSDYKNSSEELSTPDGSTKFSPWLAQGCLSPKLVYQELMKYKSVNPRDKSIACLKLSLLRRDFLRLIAKKYEEQIFSPSGLTDSTSFEGTESHEQLMKWVNGETGVAFIDANMKEIAKTGYMSYRGRMNVSSYLIHDMGVHWRMGAEYFESQLIDYDVASNWCNWQYAAGVASDPREKKQFVTESQALRYDPREEYVDKWLLEQPVESDETQQLRMTG
jgi:deoxyribodipyrimidine photo-lyase